MDCGPTALYALLTGCGRPVSYARLREACQTDVDGTSINALQRVASALGLEASQILSPPDHVAHPATSTLPAIAVTRLASGATHFVLVWRRVGPWVQVMDPASGRRWLRAAELRRSLYIHAVDLPADVWRRFAGTKSAERILEGELAALGHRAARARTIEALADPGWRTIAALEASMRMVRSLVAARALTRGSEAERMLDALFQRARAGDDGSLAAVPPVYWTVHEQPRGPDGAQVLRVRGALLVRALRLRDEADDSVATESPANRRGPDRGAATAEGSDDAGASERQKPRARPVLQLSRELALAVSEPAVRVGRELWARIAPADRRSAVGLVALVLVSALSVLVQALVFRSLFELSSSLRLPEQRLGAAVALTAFLTALVCFELPLASGFLRLGRNLEMRVRIAFQERLPRLSERWLGSRPASDMAERAHSLFVLSQVPTLAGRTVRGLATLACTAVGLCWLDPASTPLVIACVVVAVVLPLAFGRALTERELLVRSHHGALSRFYLEALLGLVAVRVHGAATALRREHESLLVEWVRAGLKLARGSVALRVATSSCGAALAIGLFASHVLRLGATPAALLFAYWAMSLPALGEQLAQAVQQATPMRNAMLRSLEPLGATLASASVPVRTAPEIEPDALSVAASPLLKAAGAAGPTPAVTGSPQFSRIARGIAVELRSLDLTLGGQRVLSALDLEIEPGEHLALIGRSGAGKSSLIALLLGLYRPSEGRLFADGELLEGATLDHVRRAIAWVDPAAQLWNESLFANLVYGTGETDARELARVLSECELEGLLESLPDGLGTSLGEGGGFLSGGEGQRVRLARAQLRTGVRLALLDEPFRGLDRIARHRLLARAREHWRSATLVCATHDVEETKSFDRVVVLDGGRIVEQGAPSALAQDPRSHFARMLAAERALLEGSWTAGAWTRWRVEDGQVRVVSAPEEHA